MAQAIVSFVLERLGEVIFDETVAETRFLLEVREKVDNAKREREMIRCFLKDADARPQRGDNVIRQYCLEIAEAANDLEDVIVTFKLREEATAFHGVGSKIDGIFNRLSKLTERLQRYAVLRNNNVGVASSSDERQKDLRRTYAHVPEDDFVENEGSMMELVTQLTKEGNSSSQVVSIYDMGGLGKSSLAKMVYHHAQVRRHFKCFAWVFVSQEFKAKDIWKRVLLDLVSDTSEKKEIRKMEHDELAKKLYYVLQKKKCLVVLDDLWEKADWDLLSKPAFPKERTGSKILVTTRRRDVPELPGSRVFLYQPPYLDDNASWELLKKKTFFHEDAPSQVDYEQMEKLGKDMLKHCGGLPLAVTVLGGLLSTKHTLDEWKTLHINVKKLINNSESIDEQHHQGVSWLLGLSYDHLPYQLKRCFLHLANFPQNYEINVKELCRLWTAEDFLPTENVSYEYLMALVDRGMVQVGRRSSIVGRIKTCRIHNLMRDLCLSKARDENFLSLINFQEAEDSGVSTQNLPNSKVLRLVVRSNENIVDELPHLTNNRDGCLRSLMCFGPKNGLDFHHLMKSLFKCFHMLRVFKFENTSNCPLNPRYHQIPEEIGRLVHLRLFSLRDCNEVFQLPSSIANLGCLQTLDLRTNGHFMEMNSSSLESMDVISKLNCLRHLYLPLCLRVHLDKRIQLGNLKSLETLVNFDTRYCEVDDLSQLTKLTKLSIFTHQDLGEIMPASNLQSLLVRTTITSHFVDIMPFLSSHPQIQKLTLRGKLVKSLENINFPNLVKLTMEGNNLEDDPMRILGELSKLRVLVLGSESYNGKKMVSRRDSFPQLEYLSIQNLQNLEEWSVDERALSKLCRLEIQPCYNLTLYPDGLRNITTLTNIEIDNMSEDFKGSFHHPKRRRRKLPR